MTSLVKNIISTKREILLPRYVPTLFVGLGGSGRDVLMRLRRKLHYAHGPERLPYLQYLMLDGDMERWWPDGATPQEYEPVKPESNELIDCRVSPDQLHKVFESLDKQGDARFSKWLKPALQRNVGIYDPVYGRQLGRVAFLLRCDEIRARITGQLRGLLADLSRMGQDAAGGAEVETNAIEIVIVTSLAGSTGAGMFLDTAFLVRDILRSHPLLNSLAFKYVSLIAVMPTAFEDLVDHHRFRRMQADAYASLLEMERYATPRTCDDMFVGRVHDEGGGSHCAGFVAPWKNNEILEGSAWDTCYLIDNVNSLRRGIPLTLPETYQMVADYLALDFEHSQFAVQKRSNRCNLSQFRDDMLSVWIRDPEIVEDQETRIDQDSDVVFATRFSCSFSSFGLSEISFQRNRMYQAAGYLLASRLVLEHWLGSQHADPRPDYRKWVAEDLFDDGDVFAFHPETLLTCLYQDGHSNWYQAALAECDQLTDVPTSDGLCAALAKHEALLQLEPTQGLAYRTLIENVGRQSHATSGLPPLLGRIFDLSRRRANQFGIARTRELLDHYREAVREVAEWAGRTEPEGEGIQRLREAESLGIPARKMARNIELQRACAETKSVILAEYGAKVGPLVVEQMRRILDFIGNELAESPSARADGFGTLHDYFKRSEKQLGTIGEWLRKRFEEYRRQNGGVQSQLLSPDWWTEETYHERIDKCLAAHPDLGFDDSGHRLVWERLEERLLAILRSRQPLVFDKGCNTLTALLDHWFERDQSDDEAIPHVAETLAAACRDLLVEVELDLQDYYEGCVIDLLQLGDSPNERNNRLDRLVRSSMPYLPLNQSFQDTLANNYQPHFDNLISVQEGEIPGIGARNREQLLEKINQISQEVDGGMGDMTPVGGDPTSLVLCRESWGVPLQYYAYLDTLHEAYAERTGDVDECHINSYECAEDLPDIRTFSPIGSENIRANAETIIFGVIVGLISTKDGAYFVQVPAEEGGVDVRRLGRRISHVVRNACEQSGVREYLRDKREAWEEDAAPSEWAMVYASTLATWDATRAAWSDGSNSQVSPLRNCIAKLMRRVQKCLAGDAEGQRWLRYLTPAVESDHEAQGDWMDSVVRLISDEQVLVRRDPAVPLWQIDWSKIEGLTPGDNQC